MYRRTRGDMIEVFKILTDKYDTNVTFSFLTFCIRNLCSM